MRSWRAVIGLGVGLAIGTVSLASCSSASTRPSVSSTTVSVTSPSDLATTPVQSGFDGHQYFCAQQPLTGDIEYNGMSGNVVMHLDVRGLPSQVPVYLNWLNNTVRGYVIGVFSTDDGGSAVPTSLHLYRPGEQRGYEIILTSTATVPQTLGELWPCGPPPRVPALTVDDPMIAVTPNTGLRDGQQVEVAASGFGVNGKVRLSECAHAEDANYLGCGPQPAAQPFLITDGSR